MLVVTLLLLATLQSPDRTPTSVRVFVFTHISSPTSLTEEEVERRAAVDDMREALKRKKGITVVDEPTEANVEMEVTGRERRDEPGHLAQARREQQQRQHEREVVPAGEDVLDLRDLPPLHFQNFCAGPPRRGLHKFQPR